MENYSIVPNVSLVIVSKDLKELKLKMRNSTTGQLQDTVALPVLDYMLSSYKNLEKYFEAALEKGWILSKDVTVKIVGEDGVEYPLPFEGNNRDIIFRCSESAFYSYVKGQTEDEKVYYISKGDKDKRGQVDNKEFSDFFNEFLSNVLDDTGHELVQTNYFKNASFTDILNEYYYFRQKEDDIYAQDNASSLEKSFVPSKNPKTIEDYLRYYAIFREAICFNLECRKKRNEKKVSKTKAKKVKGSIVHPKRYVGKTGVMEDFANKRSLCFIIGNNCEPLILKTMEPEELDDYIVDHFDSAKEVRREYQDIIKSYIFAHKDYVKQIRAMIGNNSYNGQVAILAHDNMGEFVRLYDGIYLRYPVIYSSTFRHVKHLYCNIDTLRKREATLRKEVIGADAQVRVTKAQLAFDGLKQDLETAVSELEQKSIDKKEELATVREKISKIVTDMQELEQDDYESHYDSNKPRLFSPKAVNAIRFTIATGITRDYKITLDDWARHLINSPYRYDNVRFIMRHLRKKQDTRLKDKDEVEIKDFPLDSNAKLYDSMHLVKEDIPALEEEEVFLHPNEVTQMYGEDVNASTLEKDNVHVHRNY
jgi:hypothetical protein